MIKYSRRAKRRLKYITSVQVEHVLEYGKFAPPEFVHTNSFCLFPPKYNFKLKFFNFNEDGIVVVKFKTHNDTIRILRIYRFADMY